MKIVKLIVCLSVISAICAGVLAGINVVTKETIAKIREKQTLDAAAEVTKTLLIATTNFNATS